MDAVIALGSHDERVARHAAELVLAGIAPVLVVTGGQGKDTPISWGASEAAYYRQVAEDQGVPRTQILMETRASNTGENIDFSRALLEGRGQKVHAVVLATKPYMQRRAAATAGKRWPEVRHFTSAPKLPFSDYLHGSSNLDSTEFINLMVGDLQRMKVYAERGLQLPQVIPPAVWAAYEELVAVGYDRYVLKDLDA
ncbi:YdcF family protein [Geodermatophilus sp. URMC 62]|uniref:YdcF family protein n=1 Tax=Geodermatophilus sp. URMC 62 TaxID=3423414 RepID=UPI00406C1A0A